MVVNYQNYDYGARLAFGTSIEYSAPCDQLIITSDLKIVISPVNYSLQLIKTRSRLKISAAATKYL